MTAVWPILFCANIGQVIRIQLCVRQLSQILTACFSDSRCVGNVPGCGNPWLLPGLCGKRNLLWRFRFIWAFWYLWQHRLSSCTILFTCRQSIAFSRHFLVGLLMMALMMSMAQLFLRKSTTWIFGLWFCLCASDCHGKCNYAWFYFLEIRVGHGWPCWQRSTKKKSGKWQLWWAQIKNTQQE